MLNRAALALLLLLPAAAAAQVLDNAVSAMVRISGTKDGTLVRGSGFVVNLDRDNATIVTASHVIEGMQKIEVTFAVAPSAHFPAGDILGMDAGSPHGLAAFLVQGALPDGITALSFEVARRPQLGDELFLVGFPTTELAPRTPRRVLSGRRGTLLLVDQRIGEGFSGGPVLQGGKVAGVVTETDDQTTYAVNAVVVREALEGWRVRLCVPVEENTETGIVWVRICPGTFTMGSAEKDPYAFDDQKPAHQVTLSEFWIGKTEITNEQYRRYRPDRQGEARLPVEVSWADAKAACERFGGRLPTEAEWEYAARASSQTSWLFGEDKGEYVWSFENSGNAPHSVGMKKPNAWGLHDMLGNVAEWVADWYGTYPSAPQADPSGPATGEKRVLRGGSFNSPPGSLGSTSRARFEPNFSFGFRCARSFLRQP